MTFDERIRKLKEIQTGWINYFRMASMQTKLSWCSLFKINLLQVFTNLIFYLN